MLNAHDDPEAQRLAQAAAQAFARGDRAGAADLARQLLVRWPGDARARHLLGVIALDAGDAAAARRHLEAAAAALPEDAGVANALGVALRMLGELDAARAAYVRAGGRGLIDGWRNLGALELTAKNFDASVAAYQRALALAPRDADANAQLAHIFETRHDLESAKRHAAAALAADPANAIAGVALARVLVREKDFAGAERAALPVAQAQRASRNDRSVAWGVIGDARDLVGDARRAFQAFTAANQLRLADHMALRDAEAHLYHPNGVRSMARFVADTDSGAWRSRVESAHPAPVFLVGFPRSGTTLLDQILSSHPLLMCLEEKEYFSLALASVFTSAEKLGAMHALSADEIETVRAAYWRDVRAQNDIPAGGLIIDKLPLNIVVLPLIKAVFPDAKIIFALRDPRDVILSCYQQRFGMNVGMAQFLELERAAQYYDVVMDLMMLCRARLSPDLHQVRYEDVVGDLESAARGLTAFLGVPYDAAMLNYRETALKRDITTPSARQVIQPLYARSISRWRRYAEDMAPVLPLLDAWAVRFGYDA
jgi:tetratricopeptide (TPR) repeat protein